MSLRNDGEFSRRKVASHDTVINISVAFLRHPVILDVIYDGWVIYSYVIQAAETHSPTRNAASRRPIKGISSRVIMLRCTSSHAHAVISYKVLFLFFTDAILLMEV